MKNLREETKETIKKFLEAYSWRQVNHDDPNEYAIKKDNAGNDQFVKDANGNVLKRPAKQKIKGK